MGHDDGFVTDGKPGIGAAAQEAVEAYEDVTAEIRFADFSAMRRDVASVQAGIDDKAIFLGVGPFPKPEFCRKARWATKTFSPIWVWPLVTA